jgi:(1->4)-alpha-D-glucan 1-alpha-D-glucosylmutase
MTPRATYRLQFHAGFGFKEAAAIAPYLSRLGVSHIYASPYLKARPGSMHGYDVIDHHALNPELGGEDDFAEMTRAFQREGLGQILDFVPNHMGVGGADNALWLDVLEWGQDSNFAGWFDIDWRPNGDYLAGKVLAPFLADQYGIELSSGKLVLRYEDDEGSFALWAYDVHKLPICPLRYDLVLGRDEISLDRLSDLFLDLPTWRPQIVERARALKGDLATLTRENPQARAALDQRIATLNADWRALDRLIKEQHWRVAYHGVAGDEINYRRFFNINDLAGLRMELPAVFQHAHARIIQMIEDGVLDGLRLDHVDGLFDPKAYFEALRAASTRPFYLVVEKILATHEQLRRDWRIDGTTGYDYANLSLGVLIDPVAETSFTRTYRNFVGAETPFEEIVRACKLRVMENEMASELNALGRNAARLARQNPMTTDFTRQILQRAIKQVIASFPVYRTYLDTNGEWTEEDQRDLDWAVSRARRDDPDIDASVFDFVHAILSGQIALQPKSGFSRAAALRLAMKAQQYSGPVMAKGLEDTAFYRYNRFIALNEVGGEPNRFGVAVGAFHKANALRAANWPKAMLATSTHDTKRGEDARARLAVLSDLPDEWRRQVAIWSRSLRARRGDIEGKAAPDHNDEYMFYQLLVGSWPVELLDATDKGELEIYRRRVGGALQKCLREAKKHSGWVAPNAAYEDAMQAFARDALDPGRSNFLTNFLPFMRRLARLGVENSLLQTVMKLTLPGAPDIYQGCELWDLSLVDPDNRRPIDYRSREASLAALSPTLALMEGRGAVLTSLLENWRDGRIKLAVTALLLALRREQEALFASQTYEPIAIDGEKTSRALGYLRWSNEARLAVVVARFPGQREAEPHWGDSAAALPSGEWRDLLSGRLVDGGVVPLEKLFGPLPAVVLLSTQSGDRLR